MFYVSTGFFSRWITSWSQIALYIQQTTFKNLLELLTKISQTIASIPWLIAMFTAFHSLKPGTWIGPPITDSISVHAVNTFQFALANNRFCIGIGYIVVKYDKNH